MEGNDGGIMNGPELFVPPTYSILIVGFRSLRLLGECLGTLLSTVGPKHEILFLDNGSPEPEGDWVERYIRDPRLCVLRSPSNLFFAGGVNFLAQRAKGKFLILLNPDTRVEPDWLRALDEYLRISGFEAAQADLRSAKHPNQRELEGYCLDRLGRVVDIAEGKIPTSGRIFGGRGAGLVVRRDVFFEVGAMDETFKMYFDETDLCWRLNVFGYRIGYAAGSIVMHLGGGSSRKSFFPWDHFRFIRNRILSMIKNYDSASLILFLPLHLFLCAGSAGLLLLRGEPGKALARGAALPAVLPLVMPALRNRRDIQTRRRVTDRELIDQGVILRGFKFCRSKG